MRLTFHEIYTIVTSKNRVFGKEAKVFLFGSRTDDNQKGGDIDLYIIPSTAEDAYNKKIALLQLLHESLGEQKIDIIVATNPARDIEQKAQREGVELNLEIIKIKKYFNECDKHLLRISEAYADMSNMMPLTSQTYENLSKDAVQDIDQYLFRFAKLQDTMGDKIFRSILDFYEPDKKALPFMDVLNKLEKTGYIASAQEWNYLRKVRNDIAHQYDDDSIEMAQAINNIVAQRQVIENIYTQLKQKFYTDLEQGHIA